MKVLIVDDEPLARRGVRVCLNAAQDVEIIGDCSSGSEAIHCIQELHPDLVFLDIQMPDMNGFEVLARIDPTLHPLIIFLTAYDKFALQAFSAHALDYIRRGPRSRPTTLRRQTGQFPAREHQTPAR
jgi:two-component system, LytTR family, response regulator